MTDTSAVVIISSSPVAQTPSLPHHGNSESSKHPEQEPRTAIAADTPGTLFGLTPLPSSPSPVPSPSFLSTKNNWREEDVARKEPSLPSRARSPTAERSNGLQMLSEFRKSPLSQERGRENVPLVIDAVDKGHEAPPKSDTPAPAKLSLVERRRRRIAALEDDTFEPTALDLAGFTDPKGNQPAKTKSMRNGAEKPKGKAVKPRQSSKAGDTGNKVLKGKVSKASRSSVEESRDDLKPEKISGKDVVVLDEPVAHTDDLQLVEAVRRRLDWTPTKDTRTVAEGCLDASSTENDSHGSGDFGGLLKNFRFSELRRENAQGDTQSLGVIEGGPTKRRRIDLLQAQSDCHRNPEGQVVPLIPPPAPATESDRFAKPKRRRSKSPQKKPRTITARVTAQYVAHVPEEEILVVNARDKQLDLKDTSATAKKAKRTTKKRTKQASGPVEPTFVVLSPEAATKSLTDQDIVFGTCSQLERDESPTLLRETQRALEASETSMSAERCSLHNQGTHSSAKTKPISRFRSSRSLWSAAARNPDGPPVQIETIDLSCTSNVSGALGPLDKKRGEESTAHVSHPSLKVDETRNFVHRVEGDPTVNPISRRQTQTVVEDTTSQNRPQTKATEAVQEPIREQADMPNYNDLTLAELTKQIAKFGFKPIKGRKKMVELLEKCWSDIHSKERQSSQPASVGSAAQFSTLQHEIAPETVNTSSSRYEQTNKRCNSSAVATKRQASMKSRQEKKGESSARNQDDTGKGLSIPNMKSLGSHDCINAVAKEISADSIVIEEIEDSEEELIPSPTRIQRSRYWHNSSPPSSLALKLSHSKSTTSKSGTKSQDAPYEAVSPAEQITKGAPLPDLTSQITKAIRAQPKLPALQGSKRPTWHEKILLYDPIVLEDLAVWLNTEGFALVGEDREVHPGIVREWCESKGICCCFK